MGLSTDDLVAIQQLYARYNHAIDFGDAEAWAACLTPDGRMIAKGTGDFQGTEALTAFAKSMAAQINGRHWTNNLLVEGSGAGATAKCYLLFVRNGAAGHAPSVVLSGVYTDTLAKGPSGWKFAARDFAPDA